MDSFLKTFLIILLVYFGLRIVFRLYGHQILRWFARKMARRFERQFQAYNSQAQQASSQGRTADGPKFKSDSRDSQVGEYIDYEEID